MKRKFLIVLLAIISVVACAFGITACNTTPSDKGDDSGNQSHQQHTYNKQVADSKYLMSEATCTEKAVYYYSCECGEKGSEMFEYGEAKGHIYNKQVVESKYLKSEATCTKKAVYFYSCECGEKDEEMFEYSEPLGHNFKSGVCTRCEQTEPSTGLIYTLNSNQSSYSVSEIGTCSDSKVIIADFYNNLPVTSIGKSAFKN